MKVAIGLPCFGGLIHMRCARSLMVAGLALERAGIGVEWLIVEHESLITRGRNLIAHMFLKSDCDRLVFVDSDITFHPSALVMLLDRNEDVVGAAYPKKAINWANVQAAVKRGEEQPARFAADFVVNALRPRLTPYPTIEDARAGVGSADALQAQCGGDVQAPVHDGCLLAVESLGTGFLSLSREALYRVAEAHPETVYTSDDKSHRGEAIHSLFDAGVVDGRYMSEDYLFCRRWRAIGGQCWLHLNIPLGHIGSYTYTGDLHTVFQPVTA